MLYSAWKSQKQPYRKKEIKKIVFVTPTYLQWRYHLRTDDYGLKLAKNEKAGPFLTLPGKWRSRKTLEEILTKKNIL
jgi:hypothetical protein